jgi:hypothetical protein
LPILVDFTRFPILSGAVDSPADTAVARVPALIGADRYSHTRQAAKYGNAANGNMAHAQPLQNTAQVGALAPVRPCARVTGLPDTRRMSGAVSVHPRNVRSCRQHLTDARETGGSAVINRYSRLR